MIPIILFQIEDAESYLGVMEKIGILANIGVGAITIFDCFSTTFFYFKKKINHPHSPTLMSFVHLSYKH